MGSPANKEDVLNDITDSPAFARESSQQVELWNVFEKLANANNLYAAHFDKIRSIIHHVYAIGKEHQIDDSLKHDKKALAEIRHDRALLKFAEDNFDFKGNRRVKKSVKRPRKR